MIPPAENPLPPRKTLSHRIRETTPRPAIDGFSQPLDSSRLASKLFPVGGWNERNSSLPNEPSEVVCWMYSGGRFQGANPKKSEFVPRPLWIQLMKASEQLTSATFELPLKNGIRRLGRPNSFAVPFHWRLAEQETSDRMSFIRVLHPGTESLTVKSQWIRKRNTHFCASLRLSCTDDPITSRTSPVPGHLPTEMD
jgi:hypothetical protein